MSSETVATHNLSGREIEVRRVAWHDDRKETYEVFDAATGECLSGSTIFGAPPTWYEIAKMIGAPTVWNAAAPVVALVQAPDAETALAKLRARLDKAGIDVYEGSVEAPNAFASEPGVEAAF